jgi:hypothetical protein
MTPELWFWCHKLNTWIGFFLFVVFVLALLRLFWF